ncbi:DUF2769 domain-containing protein [Methanolobus bombayensis]|uniref:DUF2769 domain-containing protein n=1 Tax=Methanolobus bombayensis TaxID=38023 RepID=UPI001AE1417A|nr:DUF2769 domain-containing protein [Methanolobus bombayensis]MBP1909362.1 hypothetical protein [Methanolobus bombayensis]
MTENNSYVPEKRGKYFGICTSYHHSKGCNCPECPSYPEIGKFMFCSKGGYTGLEKKGCLCQGCIIHSKFGLEGEYFCSE